MPLIRCPRCAQAYDIPGVVAVRLSNAIATCHCGEWLAGSRAAVLARMVDASELREIDLQPYRVAADEEPPVEAAAQASAPRSIRINARGAGQTVDAVFTIGEHPLWIGRKGCHVELAESSLSLRHCSISLRNDELVLRDADSHTGTFLDGETVRETVIPDGVHIVRAGTALITIEPTSEAGTTVEPIALEVTTVETPLAAEMLQARQAAAEPPPAERVVLVCVGGPLAGQEFEIPPSGLVVGREGHVRVPDEFLSRRHFEVIRAEDGVVQVRDLGSRNGTFLNTLPARNTRVQAGDEITAGVNRFRVEHRT